MLRRNPVPRPVTAQHRHPSKKFAMAAERYRVHQPSIMALLRQFAFLCMQSRF
jgi:hypothetical protein